MLKRIHTETEYREAVEHSLHEPVILYKHSSLCELCHRTRKDIVTLQLPVYEIVVQQARPLSNKIAETLEIRHESPQTIVLHQRKPVHTMSHGKITAQSVQDAIASLHSS